MALSGMTGFARADGAFGAWSWAVEARSVNGRNLDVRFKGPPGFESLDRLVREGAQARFQRGQVSLGLQARKAESTAPARVDVAALEQMIALSRPYVERGEAAPPSFDGLLALRGVLAVGDDEEDAEARAALENAIATSLNAALDELKAARREEGTALVGVLGNLVDRIEALTATAAAEAEAQGPALKARFVARITDLAGEHAAGLEERIVQEAALLAVKADVREELDRLSAHVASARALLAAEGAAGRRLDFLAQEFMREANTLCSKSAASALTAAGLELKAVIEQFREQIQNVE
jgi:uncharacterized protein (TIGR00255 family)